MAHGLKNSEKNTLGTYKEKKIARQHIFPNKELFYLSNGFKSEENRRHKGINNLKGYGQNITFRFFV